MNGHRRITVLATAVVAVLVVAAGAGGYAVGRGVDVPRAATANFNVAGWACRNLTSRVECQSGDAYPWAELTSTRSGGITVRVHTLRDPQGGHLLRSYVRGLPVYTFTAF